jgi:hypothetical protein
VAADVVPDGEQASSSGRTVLLSRQRRGAGGVLQKQLGAQEGSGGLNCKNADDPWIVVG